MRCQNHKISKFLKKPRNYDPCVVIGPAMTMRNEQISRSSGVLQHHQDGHRPLSEEDFLMTVFAPARIKRHHFKKELNPIDNHIPKMSIHNINKAPPVRRTRFRRQRDGPHTDMSKPRPGHEDVGKSTSHRAHACTYLLHSFAWSLAWLCSCSPIHSYLM